VTEGSSRRSVLRGVGVAVGVGALGATPVSGDPAGGDTSPAVTSGGAMNVSETTATLEGSLDDLGGAAEVGVYFEHRTRGASTWQRTSEQTVSTTGAYSTNLSGLTPGTEYEFRAVTDTRDGGRFTGTTLRYTAQRPDTDVLG
jgi:hypothetical protein